MDFFLYLDKGTWAHRLDPRAKIIAVGGVFVVALLFSDPRYLIIPTVLMAGLFIATRTWENVRNLWLLIALPFLYCLLLWPLFITGHTPWFAIGPHVLTKEAALFGLGMGLRLALMMLGGLFLLSTTTVEDFTLALQRLGLPMAMGSALSLAFRWVPHLIGCGRLIVQSQRARGLDLGAGGFMGRLKRYPPLLVPLIGHTLRHTRLLAMALESKGFGPGVRRQGFAEPQMRLPEYLVLVVVGLAIIVSVTLRATGHGVSTVRF